MIRRFESLEPGLSGQRLTALRSREDGTEVSTLELFFDLVYVFAITQLSQLLLSDLTWRGALQAGILTVAIWWAWIDTAWITNWFDPHRMPVRLMLIALMLASLVMSAAIPEAWHGRAEWFAIAYVTIQIGRSAFCLFMLGRNMHAENFARITVWAVLSAPLWLAGGMVHGDTQLFLWLAAVLVDSSAPALDFRVPGLGASHAQAWTISGGHLAERCQLFVIIALGESILLTGSALSNETALTTQVVVSFLLAFATSVMMWWVYFSRAASAARRFENSDNSGVMGRAYTYFHIPMIAGVIGMAVAAELVISHPTGDVSTQLTTVAVGGMCLYLFGNAIFNSHVTHVFPIRRTTALLATALAVPFAHLLTPLILMVWIFIPLIALAVFDALDRPLPDHNQIDAAETNLRFEDD